MKPFLQTVEQYFGSYEGTTNREQVHSPIFHFNKVARKKETEQAHLCLGYKGLQMGHEDIYNLIVLNNVLGGSMSSRLFQEVREQRGLAYSVFSYHSSYEDTGMLTLYGGTGSQQLDTLYETMQETLETLKNTGITEKRAYE